MTLSPQSLSQLIKSQWGPLIAWIGPRDEAAEDIVQQAFMALAAEKKTPDDPVAWLYRTTRNIGINERKRRSRRQRRERLAAQSERQNSTAWISTEAAELAEKVSRLPDSERQVIVARLWGDMTFEQISDVMNESKASVWRRYKSAINQLRKLYGEACITKT